MKKMRRMPMMLSAIAMAAVLAACGSPAQSPAATNAPALPQPTTAPAQSATAVIVPTDNATATSAPVISQATEAPAAAPAQNVTAIKPVFIDFYAPW